MDTINKQGQQSDLFEDSSDKPKDIERIDRSTETKIESGNRKKSISLELSSAHDLNASTLFDIPRPEIPSRWESARDAAERKHVTPALFKQIRRVEALNHLNYLINLSKDEGYVWVVYGESGSGKSTFFHSLEYQTDNKIKTHIINGSKTKLLPETEFTQYLRNQIVRHKEQFGEQTPLVMILEEREDGLTTDERGSISQSLRNVLRPPGPGKNVIFVLPVTNSHQGTLFIKQAESTGVSVSSKHNVIYTFSGPSYTEHVDILVDLFVTLNDRDISDYGLQRSDLQAHVSSQQTIGQYIRTIREKLVESNQSAMRIIRSHSCRPFTVIFCFVNPLPGYRTEPILKGMSLSEYGKIRTGELLRVTDSQRAQRWRKKRQALANIISALDIRIVEIPPQIIARMLYVYKWRGAHSTQGNLRTLVEERLSQEVGLNYNTAKIVRQNLRTQLKTSNVFRIITNEGTKSYQTPKYSNVENPSEKQRKLRDIEKAETTIARIVCENSQNRQHELHDIFAQALEDLLENSGNIPNVANYKAVHIEPPLTLSEGREQSKVLQPDVVLELQERLFLLEFCWRRDDHFTYADIAAYVFRKIEESYINLPLIQALEKGEN